MAQNEGARAPDPPSPASKGPLFFRNEEKERSFLACGTLLGESLERCLMLVAREVTWENIWQTKLDRNTRTRQKNPCRRRCTSPNFLNCRIRYSLVLLRAGMMRLALP